MSKKMAQRGLSVFLLSLLTGVSASAQNAEGTLQLNFMTTCSCLLRPTELYKRPAVTLRSDVTAVVGVQVKRAEIAGMSPESLIEKFGADQSKILKNAAQAACAAKRTKGLEDYSVQIYSCSQISVGVTR